MHLERSIPPLSPHSPPAGLSSRFRHILSRDIADAPGPTRPPPLEPSATGRRVEAAATSGGSETSHAVVERLAWAQHRMGELVHLAAAGATFSPGELLALQGEMYRASQELDLAGKLVERVTSGLKQILQTPL